jgi:glutamyl-tRNA reductase
VRFSPGGTARNVTLFVTGLSHRNAPVSVREQIAVEEDKLREILGDVQASSVAGEIVILSTCNRVEVYGVAEAPGEARAAIFRHLCRQRGVDLAAVEPVLYTHVEADAVRHVFRVASSLDSMMIGEPQILGQVKEAFALAQACETVGPTLHTLFTQAFAVAKKVRSETEIARHAVSVSFAAVELAKKIFAGLSGRAVLLVGAGKMGELAAKHLVEQGAFPIYVTNRTWARAPEMARALAGTRRADPGHHRGGHRHHLHRRCPAAGDATPGAGDHPRTAATPVLHRHRRAAQCRRDGQRARPRVRVRHR